MLEEYPLSGVTLWFDPEGRVSKVGFHGAAGALYAETGALIGENWIPSTRALAFGLTAYANESDFVRALGTPVNQVEGGFSTRREVRRVWRKDNYVIDATFLVVDRTKEDRTFPKGALLSLEVSRGL